MDQIMLSTQSKLHQFDQTLYYTIQLDYEKTIRVGLLGLSEIQ